MNKVRQFWEYAKKEGAVGGFISLIASVFLLIASFFVPPMGEISPSVLQGVAELFAFATLWKLPNIIATIQDGKSITLSHGNTTVTVASKEEDEDKKEEA